MEGVWKCNPFYRILLGRSDRTFRVFFAGLLILLAPLYFFVCLQPTSSIEASAAGYPELNIPSIGLTTPVAPLKLTDRQLIAPETIAGSYTQFPNKRLIIGHSSTVFKKLSQILSGEYLSYADLNYHITSVKVLRKSDVDMEEILSPADSETIILMTCAGTPLPNQDATHRLIITAIREQPKT